MTEDHRLIKPLQTNPPRIAMPHIVTPGHRSSALTPPKIQGNSQPVARSNAPGLGPGPALADHVHQGVREIIAGTNITIDGPADAPTINATGGGGSGVFSTLYLAGHGPLKSVVGTVQPTISYSLPTVGGDTFTADANVGGIYTASPQAFIFPSAADWYVRTGWHIGASPLPPLGYDLMVHLELTGTAIAGIHCKRTALKADFDYVFSTQVVDFTIRHASFYAPTGFPVHFAITGQLGIFDPNDATAYDLDFQLARLEIWPLSPKPPAAA